MATHLIVYGHGAGDPGAVGNGETERDFNRKKLHPYIKKWADKSKHNFEFYDITGNKDLFRDTANGWGMYSIGRNKYASITEIHEDAASSSATGGHNIVSSSLKADNNDFNLASVIKKYVGWWGSVQNTRGISYRNNLLNLNVAAQRGINYRLMELGFITNATDMNNIKRNLDGYAKGIIEGITGEKLEEVKTVVKKKNDRPKHYVVTGWYTKGSGAYKQVEKFLKDNKMGYKLVAHKSGKNRYYFQVGWFWQNGSTKVKLEKFLGDNNYHHVVVTEDLLKYIYK